MKITIFFTLAVSALILPSQSHKLKCVPVSEVFQTITSTISNAMIDILKKGTSPDAEKVIEENLVNIMKVANFDFDDPSVDANGLSFI
jgi:hypothetical protein